MGKRITKKGLTAQQELFCQIYASDREFFGNGVQSYMEAFDVPKSKYMTAKTEAWKLLTNPHILARIRELIDITISDEVVDKELGKVILQDAEFNPKVAAIREYNKLKKRVDSDNNFTFPIMIPGMKLQQNNEEIGNLEKEIEGLENK